MAETPNNIIDEKYALRVVAQMTIGEIVRGIAELAKFPSPEAPASDGTGEWPRVFVDRGDGTHRVYPHPGDIGWFYNPRKPVGPPTQTVEMSQCIRDGDTELTGPAKLAKLKELGCDERGVYVGKGEKREWPKLVGQRNWEPSFACWVFQSSNKGNWWVDGQVGECIYSLDSLLEDKRMVVLDTPEARAFIAKRYDEQGNLRAEYRKGETPKVRVFTAGPAAMVWRSGLDGDYLINDRFNANATGSVGTCVQNGWDELPPAEVPAWLARHGYAIDGTRKQETPATVNDPDAGRKYGEAVEDLVRFAQDTHVACMKWGKFESGSIEETNLVSEILSAAHTASLAANRVKRLDAAQGGVR